MGTTGSIYPTWVFLWPLVKVTLVKATNFE